MTSDPSQKNKHIVRAMVAFFAVVAAEVFGIGFLLEQVMGMTPAGNTDDVRLKLDGGLKYTFYATKSGPDVDDDTKIADRCRYKVRAPSLPEDAVAKETSRVSYTSNSGSSGARHESVFSVDLRNRPTTEIEIESNIRELGASWSYATDSIWIPILTTLASFLVDMGLFFCLVIYAFKPPAKPKKNPFRVPMPNR